MAVKDKAQPHHGGAHSPIRSQLWVQSPNPLRMPEHRETDPRLSTTGSSGRWKNRGGFLLAGESRRK